MATDEHGMPMPVCGKVIVEQFGDEYHLLVDGDDGFQVVLTFCKTPDAASFFAHALNNVVECREIVRRLANSKGVSELLEITVEASKLWAKMQRESDTNGDR